MKTFDIQSELKENVDYELIPGSGENWDVRLLKGPFIETVISFNELRISEDEEYLRFDFSLVSSPDLELTEEDLDLQEHVGDVLGSILEHASARIKNEST